VNIIHKNIESIRSKIAAEAKQLGRHPDSIKIIAASKQQPISAIEQAYNAGIVDFGENYLQEALPKIRALNHLDITWHFIGKIQSNKTRLIAENFQWAHTIDRLQVGRRLNTQSPRGKILQVCVQVNIDKDPNKSGVTQEEAMNLLEQLRNLPNLQVRGLMTMLHKKENALEGYQRLKNLFEKSSINGPLNLDTLSMGMSDDYCDAIKAGSTFLRIGTSIFGRRL
tara:strand:- start:1801 stop:2475 length:675 start_codon:yes stop_codon:yes gene_type:complete